VRLNPVDFIFALILVYALMRGYSRGLLGTAAGYVGPVLAFMLAADWSDPVRDRIAEVMPATDFVLDLLAPLVVFVVVVATVRVGAAFLAKLLGVGLSVPSRIAAGSASVVVSALVLGSLVLLTAQLRPPADAKADDAGELLASPLQNMMIGLDRRFSESMLAPPLANLASSFVSETLMQQEKGNLPDRRQIEEATRKAATAVVNSVGKLPPLGSTAPRSSGAGTGSGRDANNSGRDSNGSGRDSNNSGRD